MVSARSYISLDLRKLVEEERVPTYDPRTFYPVCLGEVFQDRYRVILKLGFGCVPTVWLCKDLSMCAY